MAKPDAELADLVDEMLKAEQIVFDRKKTEKICSLMKERYNFVADLYADCRFFFVTPTEFNEKDTKKYWKEDTPERKMYSKRGY